MNRTHLLAAAIAVMTFAASPARATDSVQSVKDFLSAYDRAFNAKDLNELAKFYDASVTIYEGGGVNNGWADYRDHHLGPELKEFRDLDFGHSGVAVHPLDKAETQAYVTAEYHLKAKMGERVIDATGLATLIVVKGADGSWKIRHSHTSSRRRPTPAPAPAVGAEL